jgi:hypothetical protein
MGPEDLLRLSIWPAIRPVLLLPDPHLDLHRQQAQLLQSLVHGRHILAQSHDAHHVEQVSLILRLGAPGRGTPVARITSTVACKCHEQPSLTGKEIALLEDAGSMEVMRVVQLGLSLEAVRLVLQLQQGSAIEHIEVSNCLVRQVVCEQVLGCDVPMSTIERQLLQDIRMMMMSFICSCRNKK